MNLFFFLTLEFDLFRIACIWYKYSVLSDNTVWSFRRIFDFSFYSFYYLYWIKLPVEFEKMRLSKGQCDHWEAFSISRQGRMLSMSAKLWQRYDNWKNWWWIIHKKCKVCSRLRIITEEGRMTLQVQAAASCHVAKVNSACLSVCGKKTRFCSLLEISWSFLDFLSL